MTSSAPRANTNHHKRRSESSWAVTLYVGRRFETVVTAMMEALRDATRYGDVDDATSLSVFTNLGALLADDRGFDFRVRLTAIDQSMSNSTKQPVIIASIL